MGGRGGRGGESCFMPSQNLRLYHNKAAETVNRCHMQEITECQKQEPNQPILTWLVTGAVVPTDSLEGHEKMQ